MKLFKILVLAPIFLMGSMGIASEEEAKNLINMIYSTCHGGESEHIDRLYLKKECREIENKTSLMIFGKDQLEEIEFERDSEYKNSKIPFSIDYGAEFNGPLKIFKTKTGNKFRSPTIAMFEELEVKNIEDIYQEKPKYIKLPKGESIKLYKAMKLPDGFYVDLLKPAAENSINFGGCEKYEVHNIGIVRCWQNFGDSPFQHLSGAIFNGDDLVYSIYSGGNSGTTIWPGYSFEYKNRKYFVFYSGDERKAPILVFLNDKNNYKYLELNILCPFSGESCN